MKLTQERTEMKLLTFMCPPADDSRTDDARFAISQSDQRAKKLETVIVLPAKCSFLYQSEIFDFHRLK